MKEVIVIGAGLSGLTAAYELSKRGVRPLVLEAAARPGGRIQSVRGARGEGPFEMGATWFGEKHQALNTLLQELGIGRFAQFARGQGRYEVMSFLPPQAFELPYSQEPYYRIQGGSAALIEALVERVGADHVRLATPVRRLIRQDEHWQILTMEDVGWSARRLVLALPPKLMAGTLAFEPDLPAPLRGLMASTVAWMSHAIKFWVVYDQPFWRDAGLAGMAMSQTGIVQEVHDHANAEETSFALMGFLSVKAHSLSPVQRESETIRHLQRLFGPAAAGYRQYAEKVWSDDALLTTGEVEYLHYHPGYGHPVWNKSYYDSSLFFAGTETSDVFGGYMEGAVHAGRRAAAAVVEAMGS